MKTDQWQTYSWEPSTKIPGGRKHREDAVFEAPNRMSAKSKFLEKFPDEMPFSIAASRVKAVTAKESVQSTAVVESPSAAPALTATVIKKRGGQDALLQSHALWDKVQEMVSIAGNTMEAHSRRQDALAWLSGVARVDVASTLSVYCREQVDLLGKDLWNSDEIDPANGEESL